MGTPAARPSASLRRSWTAALSPWAVLAIVLLISSAALARESRAGGGGFRQAIEVKRLVIDVHPIDPSGRLMRGLDLSDFSVWIDRRPVELVAVEWIPEIAERGAEQMGRSASRWTTRGGRAEVAGRTIVLFFQRDLHASRISGLMRVARHVERFLDTLEPADEVAILVFDNELRLHADFTRDKEALTRTLGETVVRYAPPQPGSRETGFSIAASIDHPASRRAVSVESALELTARALRSVRGPKSMLFFCWGFGRMSGDSVWLGRSYDRVLDALLDANVTVYSLDVTQANRHTLEGPLMMLADDTGGFYRRTVDFPFQAIDAVRRALDGHYQLVVKPPELADGTHRVRVRLTSRAGHVVHRPLVHVPAIRP